MNLIKFIYFSFKRYYQHFISYYEYEMNVYLLVLILILLLLFITNPFFYKIYKLILNISSIYLQ